MSTTGYKRMMDLPETIREAIFAYEVLRSLGFPADEIYVRMQAAFGLLSIVLRHVDSPEWAWDIGLVDDEWKVETSFSVGWTEAVRLWHETCGDPIVRNAYFASRARGDLVGVMMSLISKGVRIPVVVKTGESPQA